MGVSTNGVIFYGYCWSEEQRLLPEDFDGEWADYLYQKRGHFNPYDNYPKELAEIRDYAKRDAAWKAWRESNREQLDKRYELKRQIESEFGCDIGYHGSQDWNCPYVYISESDITARRGYPIQLTPEWFPIKPGWDAQLARFCTALEIVPPQPKPKWWLVSYWG